MQKVPQEFRDRLHRVLEELTDNPHAFDADQLKRFLDTGVYEALPRGLESIDQH